MANQSQDITEKYCQGQIPLLKYKQGKPLVLIL